jgi:hypothetical protein
MSESIPAAARTLGVSEATLRRWLRVGAPVARRGGRGRGRRTLVDAAAIEAWRGCGKASDALVVFAAELPELVADAVHEAFMLTGGPHKRATAGVLAATWYVVTVGILDRLRADVPDLHDPTLVPEKIAHLRMIFAACRNVGRD